MTQDEYMKILRKVQQFQQLLVGVHDIRFDIRSGEMDSKPIMVAFLMDVERREQIMMFDLSLGDRLEDAKSGIKKLAEKVKELNSKDKL